MQQCEQDEIRLLMREILQDEYLELTVVDYRVTDQLFSNRCDIELSVKDGRSDDNLLIKGRGVGLVDAAWQGLQARFSEEHPSLTSLKFSRFKAKGLIQPSKGQQVDAEAQVELGVKNSYGVEFDFNVTSRSLGHACVQGVAQAVQYFANSELTFVRMHKIRRYYQAEGRIELVSKYTVLMSKMVRNTSYSAVIDRIRDELN